MTMLKNRILNRSSHALGRIAKAIGHSIPNPIVILGSGRCGTTLLHRILKSNKKICIYPTEANELWHPSCFPYSNAKVKTPPILLNPGKFTDISLKAWPDGHGQYIQHAFSGFSLLNNQCSIFVVKSAMISHMIPTILTLFKEARFIHIYRNGISVIDSLYKKERQKYMKIFPDDNQFLLACAKYWVECISEIEFRDKLLSLSARNRLYQLSYEELCARPEKQIAKLALFIGCDETDFIFDYKEISSTNYKVANYSEEKKWEPVLNLILPMMIEKGYQ